MTTASSLDLAERVAGWARDGEQVEAYVARTHDTDVRVYDGDVESLSSAADRGRRRPGRRRTAAGVRLRRLARRAVARARRSPRRATTRGSARVDEFLGLAEPDGVAAADLDLFREELAAFPTDRKVELALELERAVRGRRPAASAASRRAEYGDASIEAAIASSTGVRA